MYIILHGHVFESTESHCGHGSLPYLLPLSDPTTHLEGISRGLYEMARSCARGSVIANERMSSPAGTCQEIDINMYKRNGSHWSEENIRTSAYIQNGKTMNDPTTSTRIVEPSGKHSPAGGSRGADRQSVTKRLQQELKQLLMSNTPGVSAFPNGDDMYSWVGTIEGSTGTPYESQKYRLSVKFTNDYPYKAPVVRFETPCFHPNVDQYGNICLDILKEEWSAVYNIRTILLSLQSLLGEPNVSSPLNGYAAALWANPPEYAKVNARKYAETTSNSN